MCNHIRAKTSLGLYVTSNGVEGFALLGLCYKLSFALCRSKALMLRSLDLIDVQFFPTRGLRPT
jgi:hypothetical protein